MHQNLQGHYARSSPRHARPLGCDLSIIRALLHAGAFRPNFSHATHTQHQERLDLIRRV